MTIELTKRYLKNNRFEKVNTRPGNLDGGKGVDYLKYIIIIIIIIPDTLKNKVQLQQVLYTWKRVDLISVFFLFFSFFMLGGFNWVWNGIWNERNNFCGIWKVGNWIKERKALFKKHFLGIWQDWENGLGMVGKIWECFFQVFYFFLMLWFQSIFSKYTLQNHHNYN